MRTARWLAVLLALIAPALGGCGEDDEGSSGSGGDGDGKPQLTVSAASSLKTAFTEYGKQLSDANAKFSFAGSDELAAQIEQGVKPDVYAAANTSLPDELYQKGLVEQPTTFAGNELVLAVPADSDKVAALEDLANDGVTIAIGQEDVPVGSYTHTVLDKLPPEQSEAIVANLRSEEPDVAGITGKLTQGAVDAGFLYISDVRATDGQLTAITLPDDLQPQVAYGIAVVKGAKEPEAAQAFIDGLLDGAGAQALTDAGFDPPEQ
ncbi:MAG TPA: molybdate ABC transporter substrate-binding protein [Solirubrobacteraceae bacterium]|jgi:molybdate transport system substrate-binding protein|nr:molybdate ABC transporter substrate-binding protein [Solirubrobacteraceae bacterium]